MKLTTLLEIKSEADRFYDKLSNAIERAKNDTDYSTRISGEWIKQPKPETLKNCDYTKESGSFKRAALDLKRKLSNL